MHSVNTWLFRNDDTETVIQGIIDARFGSGKEDVVEDNSEFWPGACLKLAS